jgi:hypothetical protein
MRWTGTTWTVIEPPSFAATAEFGGVAVLVPDEVSAVGGRGTRTLTDPDEIENLGDLLGRHVVGDQGQPEPGTDLEHPRLHHARALDALPVGHRLLRQAGTPRALIERRC